MRVHLVNGFLGSGKTTAIANAAKQLMADGQNVGVVTNDQGKYLIDTAFFKLSDIPAVEVTGGCFCCNYSLLDEQLAHLKAEYQPDIIFAEAVGSCADIVAAVIEPRSITLEQINSFSVFADARLLRRRLLDQPLMFSEDVLYIFDQQLDEADLVVVNKIDLLDAETLAGLRELVQQRFPGKRVRYQNSHAASDVAGWLAQLGDLDGTLTVQRSAIDYERYAHGEVQLAWMDQSYELHAAEGQTRATLIALIELIQRRLNDARIPIAHLKMLVQPGQAQPLKLSLTGAEAGSPADTIPDLPDRPVKLLVNARVEGDAATVRELITGAIADAARAVGATVRLEHEEAFHPAPPSPPASGQIGAS